MFDFMWPWKLENASPSVPQMNQLNQWATQISERFESMSYLTKIEIIMTFFEFYQSTFNLFNKPETKNEEYEGADSAKT